MNWTRTLKQRNKVWLWCFGDDMQSDVEENVTDQASSLFEDDGSHDDVEISLYRIKTGSNPHPHSKLLTMTVQQILY